jgi:glucose/arabinose dehydrogenase
MTEQSWTRRQLLRTGAVAAGATGLVGTASAHGDRDAMAQEALVGGYGVREFAPIRLPTAMTFGPEGDLYVASIPRSGYEDLVLPPDAADQVKSATGGNGTVERVGVENTPAGPVATGTTTVASGLDFPLGVAVNDSELYVSDNRRRINGVDRLKATIFRAPADGAGEKRKIIDGIPSGPIHDANHMEFGPDGRLHIAVGSSTCNGQNYGVQEIHPYTGSILRITPGDVTGNPAELYWTDGNDAPILSDSSGWDNVDREIAAHPRNDDFNEKVDIVARGFRNIFGIAFDSDGVPHTGMNGSQGPASQDVFYRLDELGSGNLSTGNPNRVIDEFEDAPHYGFPYTLNFTEGDEEGSGREAENIELRPNPVYDDSRDIDPADYVPGDALMGWHVCATGLDFPTEGQYAFPEEVSGDAYIAECGAYEARRTVEKTRQGHDTDNTGHKVTRVKLNDDGSIEGYQDWLAGFSSPTDVTFGPEGAMYIADLDNGVFVAQPTPATTL